MRAALRTATEAPLSVGRVQLRMSVGLHAGTVQLFRVGTLHQELIVTGPAATRTTQMEHAAVAGEIFVSPEHGGAASPPAATRPGPVGDGACCGGGERRWRPRRRVPGRRRCPPRRSRRAFPASSASTSGHGEVEFEHRIAAVAFIRFRGVDALLAAAGPTRWPTPCTRW